MSLASETRKAIGGLKAFIGLTFGAKSALLDGIRVNLENVPKAAKRAILKGTYEGSERFLVKKYVKPDDRVLELGACLGVVSCSLCRIVGDEALTVVEPNPQAISILMTNFELNGFKPRLIEGLASADGTTNSLNVDENKIASSSSINFSDQTRNLTTHAVNVNKLIVEFKPTVLVLDIEGSEIELFENLEFGSIRTIIAEFHPWLVGEDKVRQSKDVLTTNGFKDVEPGKYKDVACLVR